MYCKDCGISVPCDGLTRANLLVGLPDGARIDGHRPPKPEGKNCAEENSQ